MATIDGSWHPGIGDPTPLGWITVAAYGVAAWLCWRCARSANRSALPARFWLLLALTLATLAVNKQLDLQTAITDIGRRLANAQGWYAKRQAVQVAFIAAVAVLGVFGLGTLACTARPLTIGRAVAGVGLVAILVFVLTRAASFHHVDAFLGTTLWGVRWNGILELSGIACVAIGAAIEHSGAAPRPATTR